MYVHLVTQRDFSKVKNYKYIALLWSIIILVLSLASKKYFKVGDVDNVTGLDKIVHLFMYGLFTYLWAKALIVDINMKSIIALITVASTYGTVIELMQKYMTTNRSFDMYDAIANMIGAIIGAIIFLKYK